MAFKQDRDFIRTVSHDNHIASAAVVNSTVTKPVMPGLDIQTTNATDISTSGTLANTTLRSFSPSRFAINSRDASPYQRSSTSPIVRLGMTSLTKPDTTRISSKQTTIPISSPRPISPAASIDSDESISTKVFQRFLEIVAQDMNSIKESIAAENRKSKEKQVTSYLEDKVAQDKLENECSISVRQKSLSTMFVDIQIEILLFLNLFLYYFWYD